MQAQTPDITCIIEVGLSAIFFDDISGQENHPIKAGKYTAESLRKKENDKAICLYQYNDRISSVCLYPCVREGYFTFCRLSSTGNGTMYISNRFDVEGPSLSVSATVKST